MVAPSIRALHIRSRFIAIVLASIALPVTALALAAGDPAPKPVDVPAEVKVESGSSRAWALMTCSVPCRKANMPLDLLAAMLAKEANVRTIRTLLEKKHGVKRRSDLVTVLDNHLKEGRRAKIRELFAEVLKSKLTEADIDALAGPNQTVDFEMKRLQLKALVRHAPRLAREKDALLAYDCVDYIQLCRFGYAAGYFTEADAWKRIEPIAKKLQKAYDSWADLGEVYAIGVEVFEPHLAQATWEAFEQLETGEASPWKTLAWKKQLAPLDRPEPAPKVDAPPKSEPAPKDTPPTPGK
jgi:hypothetical protein